MAERGFFAFFEQRLFATVANPTDVPRSIHVSGFDSAPLARTWKSFSTDEQAFQTGIHALRVLAGGSNVQLGTKVGQSFTLVLTELTRTHLMDRIHLKCW